MNPFFSIIIPVFNKEDYIKDTLTGVINQSYKNYEVIIVDDGSTDNSLQICKQIITQDFHILTQQNEGVSVARNKGILKAKGRYICLLDADDFWLPNHLEKLHKAISTFSELKVFTSNYFFNSSGKVSQPIFSQKTEGEYIVIDDFFKHSLANSIIMTPCVCIEANTLKNRLFDTNIKSGQDTDLWIQLGLAFKILFINHKTVQINRLPHNSLSKTNNLDSRIKVVLKHKHIEIHNLSLKKYLDQLRFSLSLQALKNQDYLKSNKLESDIYLKNLKIFKRLYILLPIKIKILILILIKN